MKIEVAARAFEGFVVAELVQTGVVNNYLANLLPEEAFEGVAAHRGQPAGGSNRLPLPDHLREGGGPGRLPIPPRRARGRLDAHDPEPRRAVSTPPHTVGP